MRHRQPILLILLLPFASVAFAALLFSSDNSVSSQTHQQRGNSNASRQNSSNASSTPTPEPSLEVVKVDIDLVKVDALVLQKNTARIVGGLTKEDFLIYEDGIK